MKIIQANKFYRLKGGAERYMFEVSKWLEEQGNEVVPFSMKHPDNVETPYLQYFVSYVQTQQVKVGGAFKTAGRMFYSLEARRKMASLIAHERPDLCHLHNIYGQISPSILHTLKDQRVPVVMTVHDHHLVSPQYNIWAEGCGEDLRDVGVLKGTWKRYHKGSFAASFLQTAAHRWHRWMRIYQHNIKFFICPSNYMKRQLIRGGIPKEQIRVNHYGIDPSNITSDFRHMGYMLFVGRLSAEKGVETILRAAKSLPDIPFKIVGRGPEMARLHRLADGLPNIEFLGFQMGEELQELYHGASAVLLPSRVHENFPLAVLEAMAAGKPVIASDVGGVPEIVKDRVNGMLVRPTDLHGWVEAIVRLAHDADHQKSLAMAARQTVQEHFRQEDHYRRLHNIYQEATEIQI
jgi:glycosyltransferase involved in cell wall biosynthesis